MHISQYQVKYKNNFSIEQNAFIKIYRALNRLRSSKNKSIRILTIVALMFFRRIAFSLVYNKKKMLVNAKIGERKFRARSTNSQFHSIYFGEYAICYEPDVYGAIERFLPEAGTMLDIGSNWGHHTIDAIFRKNATVYSFEPNIDVFNDLSRIVLDLNIRDKVVPCNFALGSEDGFLSLTQLTFESGVASVNSKFVTSRASRSSKLSQLLNRLTFKKPITQTAEVKVLDNFFDPQVHVDFIKIDCEGHELHALEGASSLISRDEPAIVFELHTNDNCTNYNAFKSFFEKIDYQLFEINADVFAGSWGIALVENLLPNTQYNILAISKLKTY